MGYFGFAACGWRGALDGLGVADRLLLREGAVLGVDLVVCEDVEDARDGGEVGNAVEEDGQCHMGELCAWEWVRV